MRLASITGASILLTACAHTGAIDDGLGFSERQSRLSAIDNWDLSGQLVIDTGESRERARVAWEQRGARLNLTVRGVVLGAGSFRIAGDDTRLVLEGRGETRVLDDPEADLERQFGWWIPVTSLDAWLLGQADADYPRQLDRGPSGTIATLEQRDWRLVYEEYQLVAGLLVPRAITMRHGNLALRLASISFEPAGEP